jgi:hypothetical protein
MKTTSDQKPNPFRAIDTCVSNSYRLAEPEQLVERIDQLVKSAVRTHIAVDRVRLYARLLIVAQDEEQWNESGNEHFRRATSEEVGALHGIDGYKNPSQAEQKYREGRKARQIVHNAALPVRSRIRKLISTIKKYHSALPLHIQPGLPESLDLAIEPLNNLIRVTRIPSDYLKQSRDRIAKRLSVATNTYLLWRYQVPSYPLKWHEMFDLARVWHLSGAADKETFRRRVLKIAKGVTQLITCPLWATPGQGHSPNA